MSRNSAALIEIVRNAVGTHEERVRSRRGIASKLASPFRPGPETQKISATALVKTPSEKTHSFHPLRPANEPHDHIIWGFIRTDPQFIIHHRIRRTGLFAYEVRQTVRHELRPFWFIGHGHNDPSNVIQIFG